MGFLCLAASGALTSPSANGSRQFFIVSESDMPKAYCCLACRMVSFQSLQSGMTCGRCISSQASSTSCTADSLAKTCQPPALEQVWRESEADFISNSKELSKKQSLLSSFLKTSLQFGHADLAVWCGDFPNSGMTCAGQLFLPQKLEPRTLGKDGFSWPTPETRERRDSIEVFQRRCEKRIAKGKQPFNPSLDIAVKLWPTPRAQSANGSGPSRTGNRTDLQTAVTRWPTPRASDTKGAVSLTQTSIRRLADGKATLPEAMQVATGGGQLNPMWVEWLMGYPLEWTVCADWATQWFRNKRAKRSSVSQESEASA